jgi:hypothetical protein
MNRINVKKIIISSLLLVSGNILFAQQNFSSKTFSLSIDGIGNITALETLSAGKNLVTKDSAGVLLQLVKDGKRYKPVSAAFAKSAITLRYQDGQIARIRVSSRNTYLRFELTEISKGADAVIWGPLNTSIGDTIGNTIGVVRSSEYAIGIIALNTKTTGGELVNEEGAV